MHTAAKERTLLFHAIPLHGIRPNSQLDFHLYGKKNGIYTLLVERGENYPEKLDTLFHNASDKPKRFYIRKSDKYLYHYHIEKYLKEVSADNSVSLEEKASLIYKSASGVVQDIFEKPESKETIKRIKSLVDTTINVVLNDETSVKTLMSMGSHDYYTYTHSVDVSVYAIGFAKYLGYSYKKIEDVGYAAMMHDIGKSKIPNHIINKKGRLEDDEFDIMKQHPVYGFNILKYHGETNENILMGVRSHHEKRDGNGYPDGLRLHQINDFAKIIAIADIFSALTTDRSYKKAFASFEALQLMKKQMLQDLDEALFFDFVRFIGHCSLQN